MMGIQIKDLRECRDLTLQDLADLAGVPLEIVQDVEIGVQEVGSEHVKRIRLALGCKSEPTGVGL
jgi:transcriptional regulator with XRE-family HTH domain